mmetsp:Transcript_81898/g.236783  ORF Transcript_81898/g.236783 Transcript_81898/m.236783 type:complete len:210 (-) Transcript_81898:373-1002(-)
MWSSMNSSCLLCGLCLAFPRGVARPLRPETLLRPERLLLPTAVLAVLLHDTSPLLRLLPQLLAASLPRPRRTPVPSNRIIKALVGNIGCPFAAARSLRPRPKARDRCVDKVRKPLSWARSNLSRNSFDNFGAAARHLSKPHTWQRAARVLGLSSSDSHSASSKSSSSSPSDSKPGSCKCQPGVSSAPSDRASVPSTTVGRCHWVWRVSV